MSFTKKTMGSEPLVGAYLSFESLLSAQLMANAGFDWVLIDMEHAPLSAREATAIVHAIAVGSHGTCSSLVRVPSTGVEWVKWALDAGAAGIVVPMVQGRADAERIVKHARYPPVGQRSFGPSNAPWADLSAGSDVAKYVSQTAPNVAVIPMIESRAGVDNAVEIIGTEGVTAIFVGPVDLRLSLGFSGADGDEPEYVQALEKILRVAKQVGIPVGIFSISPAVQRKHVAMGFRYFLVGGDSSALVNGAKEAIRNSRNVCKETKL